MVINKSSKSFLPFLSLLFLVMAVSVGVALVSGNSALFTQPQAANKDSANCSGKCKAGKETCVNGVCKSNNNNNNNNSNTSGKCNCVKKDKGTDCGSGSCTNGSCTCSNTNCEPKKGSQCTSQATASSSEGLPTCLSFTDASLVACAPDRVKFTDGKGKRCTIMSAANKAAVLKCCPKGLFPTAIVAETSSCI